MDEQTGSGENIKSYIGPGPNFKELFHFLVRDFAETAAYSVGSYLYTRKFASALTKAPKMSRGEASQVG
jgi:hypothetical protein